MGVKHAFPVMTRIGDGLRCADPGMTLRDWFAGQALAGLLATPGQVFSDPSPERLAEACYAAADALLEYRQTQP